MYPENKNLLVDIDRSDSESLHYLINDTSRLSVSFTEIEQFCISWGGCYKGINMSNTCSINNLYHQSVSTQPNTRSSNKLENPNQ